MFSSDLFQSTGRGGRWMTLIKVVMMGSHG